MRFFHTNLIDASGVIITDSSSASSSLTASNLAHEHKAKVWRTGTSNATETVTFDLGSAQSVTAAIIFAHTLTASDSGFDVRGSTDNFAASDVLIANPTFLTGYTYMISTFSSVSYRYWRFKFNKASAGVSRDIGRIFLGTYTDIDNVISFDGVNVKRPDLSQKSRSAGGQTFTDRRSQYRSIDVSMDSMTTTDKDSLKTITDTTGTHQSFWCQIDRNATSEMSEVLYVKFRDLPDAKTSGMSSDLVWDAKLELEEQL
jgi:hypothetical protein